MTARGALAAASVALLGGCFPYQASLGGTVGRLSRVVCDEQHDTQAECLRAVAAALDCEAAHEPLDDAGLKRCARMPRR